MYVYRGMKLNISDQILTNLCKVTGLPISKETIDVIVSNATGIYPNEERFSQIPEEQIKEIIIEAARPVKSTVFDTGEDNEC